MVRTITRRVALRYPTRKDPVTPELRLAVFERDQGCIGAIVLGWPSWPPERQQAWAKRVAEGVIRRILPPMLRALAERVPAAAPDILAAALRCETTGSESAAWAAMAATWAREAAEAATAAWATATAAAASDIPLKELCAIMLEAAE